MPWPQSHTLTGVNPMAATPFTRRSYDLPSLLLRQAATVAASRGESVSEFMRNALRERIAEHLCEALAVLDADNS